MTQDQVTNHISYPFQPGANCQFDKHVFIKVIDKNNELDKSEDRTLNHSPRILLQVNIKSIIYTLGRRVQIKTNITKGILLRPRSHSLCYLLTRASEEILGEAL